MSQTLRQSTAADVLVGPVLDADGVAKTDLTISAFKISKNGAAPASLNGSATATHRHTGHYSIGLTTSDTDTVGRGAITVDSTTNAMQPYRFQVVESPAGVGSGGATIYEHGQAVILRIDCGVTGLTFETAGLVITAINDNEAATVVYAVSASNVENITGTLGTYQAPSTDKCRFAPVDATNEPTLYEIHLPASRFQVSGAKRMIVTVHHEDIPGGRQRYEMSWFKLMQRDVTYRARNVDTNAEADVVFEEPT